MQNITAIRLVDERLAWYPPGASDEPRFLDDESERDSLQAALAQRRGGVCFAVPGADARLMTLPVTPAERKHINKSLPFALEEQVAEDIDELHFAHSHLDKETLAVAICSRDKMDRWRAALADFSGVQQWAPEPLLLPWSEGEWCVVVEGETAIIRAGQCEGFSIERDMAATLLQGLVAEYGEPGSIIIYGQDQDADLALLPNGLRDVAQWRKGDFYAALLLSDSAQVNLNLLQGDYAKRLPLGKWSRQWRTVAVVFAVAFFLQLMALYADYRDLNAENVALRTEVQESYRKAFPKGQVVDAEKQLSRQLDAIRGTAQSSGFVTLVEPVGAAVAGMKDASIVQLNYNDKNNEMRINVVAADFEGIEKLRSKINEAGLDAEMESSNRQGDKVRARLRIGKRS